MIKIILLFSTLFCFLEANYKIIDNENNFIIKIKNKDFKILYANLKDEINFQSFIIVHELDLAKSTVNVALALEKEAILKNGINILICKSSFTLEMHEENIENIIFCPLGISIYQNKNNEIFISYKKYKALKNGDKIAAKINGVLKSLIIQSLD